MSHLNGTLMLREYGKPANKETLNSETSFISSPKYIHSSPKLGDSHPLQRGSPMASPHRNSPVSFTHSNHSSDNDSSCTDPQYHFTDVAHSKDLVNALKFLRQDEDLCDVVLRVGSTSISAHKVVLAASSPYFKAMFAGGLSESQQNTVTLQELDERAMETIVNYFYSGEIEISEDNVQDLLPVTCLLQVQSVQKACCEFLKRQLSSENCLGIVAFADRHDCSDLVTSSESFAKHHFIEVVQSEEFMDISAKQLSRILSDDDLNIQSEERVFEAALAWIKYDSDVRQESAPEILGNVRFPLLSAEFLMDRVATEEIIRNNRACSDLLLEATECLLLPKRKSQIHSHRVSPRRPTTVNYVMYAIGGMSRREASKSGEKYDPRERKWKTIGDMNICRWGAAVGALGPFLYICGGSDDASRLETVERFDPFANVWVPSVPMSSSRNGVGVTAGSGRIYAIGGFDGSMPLNTAEYYDPKVGKWTEISRMNQCRFGVGCAVLHDMVYAVGGSDGTNLKTVERYDPDTNTWKMVASMSTARKQVGVATLGGFLYAIGGCDHGHRYDTVERYDPGKDEWVSVATMSTPRSGCGVGVLDGFIYVVGGYDGTSYLISVERMPNLESNVPSGREVADLVRTLAEVHNNPAALEAIREATTSCLQWGDVLLKLMKPDTVQPLFIRKQGVTVRPQDFARIAEELREGNAVLISVKLPGSTNHVFTIEGIGDGKAHVLHAWQNNHTLRVEKAMPVKELVEHLERLPTLDHVTDKVEIQRIRGKLWGADHAEVPDIGTGSRSRVSYEQIIKGKPDGPLTSPVNRSRLSSLSSDISEWQSARSSGSRMTEWRSVRSSVSSEGEPHGGNQVRGNIKIRWGAGFGAGLGFVFGAGGVLLVGVIRGEKIDYSEVGLEGLKGGLSGGVGGGAGAAAAKGLAPTFARIGVSVVRANAIAGVAMFGVLAIWDVVEWRMHRITEVELRKRLAGGVGAAGGGILGGAAAGVGGGLLFGPVGAIVGVIAGGIAGGVGGMFAGNAIDTAIWDESEDAVMISYESFGWHNVKRNTRPLKSAEEIGNAYDKKLGEKPKKIEEEDWNKFCIGNLMILLPAMYPEFKVLMNLADELKKKKNDGLSSIATAFYEYIQEE